MQDAVTDQSPWEADKVKGQCELNNDRGNNLFHNSMLSISNRSGGCSSGSSDSGTGSPTDDARRLQDSPRSETSQTPSTVLGESPYLRYTTSQFYLKSFTGLSKVSDHSIEDMCFAK